MGRVEKGESCGVSGCSEPAQRSISGSKASMNNKQDLTELPL